MIETVPNMDEQIAHSEFELLSGEQKDEFSKVINRFLRDGGEVDFLVDNFLNSTIDEWKVSFFRQNNFTCCVLLTESNEVIPGIAKKHPEEDPDYLPEVGCSVAFSRAVQNFLKSR